MFAHQSGRPSHSTGIVSGRFMDLSEHSEEFLGHMQDTYRPTLDDVEGTAEDVMTDLFDRFLRSFVFWDAFQYSADSLAADCQPFVASYRWVVKSVHCWCYASV